MAGRQKRSKPAEKPAGERLKAFLASARGRFPRDQDFAEAIEISPGRLSQLLAGVGGPPSPGLARRIEDACGRAIAWSAWFEAPAAVR